MCGNVCMSLGVQRGHNRVSDLQELELWVAVSLLTCMGIELGSSGRTGHTLQLSITCI